MENSESKVETCSVSGEDAAHEISQSGDESEQLNILKLSNKSINSDNQSSKLLDSKALTADSHNGQQQNVTLTPVRLPAILDGEYFSVTRLENTNVTAQCIQCEKLLNGSLKSTGNFLSHIKRVHPMLIDKIKCKSSQRRPAIFIDLSTGRCPEIKKLKIKKLKSHFQASEDSHENHNETSESLLNKKRKQDVFDVSSNSRIPSTHSIGDEYDAIGKNVAAKLRNMRVDQRIIAEKLLNDILFEAQLGNLHRDSSIQV